jgi:hypothetical protein
MQHVLASVLALADTGCLCQAQCLDAYTERRGTPTGAMPGSGRPEFVGGLPGGQHCLVEVPSQVHSFSRAVHLGALRPTSNCPDQAGWTFRSCSLFIPDN